MFNLPTGGELLIIFLVALIVLGPDKMPDAIRKAGRLYGEVRRMAYGFKAELRDAIDEPKGAFNELKEPLEGLRTTMKDARSTFLAAATEPLSSPNGGVDKAPADGGDAATPELPGEPFDAELGDPGLVEVGPVEVGPVDLPTAEPAVPGDADPAQPHEV